MPIAHDPSSSSDAHHSISRRTVVRASAMGGLALGASALLATLVSAQDSSPEASTEASPEAAHDHIMSTPSAPSGLADLPSLEPVAGEPLRTVETIESVDGILDITLEAKITEATVAGKTVRTATFNGSFPGPTWVFNPGDTVRVHLINNLDEWTNLHTHGFHVSPQNNSDNVLLRIEAGETFDYEYQIPDTHPAGVYWYHPHPHGISEKQATSGMVGSIIINGGLDLVPGIQGLRQQHLLLQVNEFADTGEQVPFNEQKQAKQIHLVNGQYQPTISIQPGELQRWAVSNASANNFFLFTLAGHRLHQIAKDGNPFNKIITHDQILVGPGERVEFLVEASNAPGTHEFRQLPWGTGFQAEPDRLLATMVIEGDAVPVAPMPDQLIPYSDLRDMPIDNERVIVFSPAPPPYYQWINNTPFNMDVVNETMKLGTLEKWTIQNTTEEVHPFHIHINDFQVISINGESIDAPSVSDTVNIPAGGEVEILHRFEDFTGKYVFHCHILMHEDAGMMAIVEVIP